MKSLLQSEPSESRGAQTRPVLSRLIAWLMVVVAGFAAPATALVLIGNGAEPETLANASAPVLAVALMGSGMIGAAVSARFWVGIGCAIAASMALIVLALANGGPQVGNTAFVLLAILVASVSFSARGALFARSAGDKGWWIAVFVVAGEAAILATAIAMPGALPDWLLVLLPAQWANLALGSGIAESGVFSATPIAALIALGGTAAATLLVARLLPRRWPYLVMFTTWLALSAVVWQQSGGQINPSHGEANQDQSQSEARLQDEFARKW